MALRFNPAPGWPAAPTGWLPPAGWQPDASWPPAPPGWQIVVDETMVQHDAYAAAVAPAGGPSRVRPWYKKKRFLIPAAIVLLFGFIGSLNPDPPMGLSCCVRRETRMPF
jgi:hypothetical protein